MVAKGFAVAKPSGDFFGECAREKTLEREFWKSGQVAFLERRKSAAWKSVEHHGKSCENEAYDEEIETRKSHNQEKF